MFASLVGKFIPFAVFGYLYSTNRERYLGFWTLAWGVETSRIAVTIVLGATSPAWMRLPEQLLLLTGAMLFLLGSFALGKRAPPKWVWWAAVAGVVWITAATLSDFELSVLALPTHWFLAGIMIWSGVAFIRFSGVPGVETYCAGIGLVLWGLHQADYPFLRPISWFAPWGYAIALAITTFTAVSILLVYFEIVRQDLAQSNLRFDKLFEHSHDAIFMLDPETDRILEANPQALAMLGYDRDELLGMKVSHIHNSPTDASAFEGVLSTPGGWVGELDYVARDGHIIPTETAASAMMVGDTTGVFAVARDVSERRRNERQVRQLNEELETRVAERTAALQAANEELEAFSYSVSHDLRAPLRAIDGFTTVMLEEHGSELSESAMRYQRLVQTNAAHMGRLIDDLLSFARLNRQPLSKQTVAPADLVRQSIEDLSNEMNGREIDVQIGNLPSCLADATLLRQVYTNLISNALKFTRHRERAIIECGWTPDGDGGVYYVRDNGVGFEEEYADKLFGVFQRLHRFEDYEGTGVGLALVDRIIRRHGGRIWAESEPDKGATFNFTL